MYDLIAGISWVPGEGGLIQKRGQSRLVDSFKEGSWICISFPGSCCNKVPQTGMAENHGNGFPNSCRGLMPQTEALAEPAEGSSSGPLSPASWCCRPFLTSPGLWTHHFGLSLHLHGASFLPAVTAASLFS